MLWIVICSLVSATLLRVSTGECLLIASYCHLSPPSNSPQTAGSFATNPNRAKHSRILEGLTKYWGFYFVASPDANDVGIRDLQIILDNVVNEEGWMSDLHHLHSKDRRRQNESNSRLAFKHLRKLLAARIVVPVFPTACHRGRWEITREA